MTDIITTSFTVDWIAATFERDGAEMFLEGFRSDGEQPPRSANPARGYNKAFEFESGLRYNLHTEKPEMGVHVFFTGSVILHYWARGTGWMQIMECVAGWGGRTSRVDLAFDLKGSKLTNEILCQPALKPYKGGGRKPKFTEVRGGDGSWTTYIGSRTSEKFLRIYDKAKEQGDYESDYIRVELECKGECAHAVGWNFAREGEAECVGMARTLLFGVADFNLPAWEIGLNGVLVEFSIPQGKRRDTFGWLIKVCAPALAKEIAKHPKEDILDTFWDALRLELGKQGVRVETEALDPQ
jgi:hypothetical protein